MTRVRRVGDATTMEQCPRDSEKYGIGSRAGAVSIDAGETELRTRAAAGVVRLPSTWDGCRSEKLPTVQGSSMGRCRSKSSNRQLLGRSSREVVCSTDLAKATEVYTSRGRSISISH